MSYLLLRGLRALLRALPRGAAYRLAAIAAVVWWHSDPERRETLLSNLGNARPDLGPRALRRCARLNLRLYTMALVDFARMDPAEGRELSRLVTIDGQEIAERVLSGERGLMAATIHMGSWEVIAAAWAQGNKPFSIVAETLSPPALDEWYVRSRRAMGVSVIPLGAAALRQVHRALSRGELVAVALDRDVSGVGRPVTLFGAPTTMARGALELAHEAGVPVVPVFLRRDGARFRVRVHEPLEPDPALSREEDSDRLAQAFLRIAEREIAATPEQWHVLQTVWTPAPCVPAQPEMLAAPHG
ncbi:MAG: lysophospholipid acyltransferase family protein [Candidatus Dormibacteria bacterium]